MIAAHTSGYYPSEHQSKSSGTCRESRQYANLTSLCDMAQATFSNIRLQESSPHLRNAMA